MGEGGGEVTCGRRVLDALAAILVIVPPRGDRLPLAIQRAREEGLPPRTVRQRVQVPKDRGESVALPQIHAFNHIRLLQVLLWVEVIPVRLVHLLLRVLDHLDVLPFIVPRAGQSMHAALQPCDLRRATARDECVGARAHFGRVIAGAVSVCDTGARQAGRRHCLDELGFLRGQKALGRKNSRSQAERPEAENLLAW